MLIDNKLEYLVMAYNYGTDGSEFAWCEDEKDLKLECLYFEEDGFSIVFAGKVSVEKEYSLSSGSLVLIEPKGGSK